MTNSEKEFYNRFKQCKYVDKADCLSADSNSCEYKVDKIRENGVIHHFENQYCTACTSSKRRMNNECFRL